jgi:hypothetical protein
MADLPSPEPKIIEAIEELLAANGPMEFEELFDALTASELRLSDDPEDLLMLLLAPDKVPLAIELPDGRFVLLSALLAGRTFTHRVTGSEIEHDLIDPVGDLAPLAVVLDDHRHRRFAGGAAFSRIFADSELPADREFPATGFPDGWLLLPSGTFRGLDVSVGDLVGLRFTDDGFVVERVDDVAIPPTDLRSRILALMDEHDLDEPLELEILVWELCADDPELLRAPLPPLADVLDMLEFPHKDNWLGYPGFDFQIWQTKLRLTSVRKLYGLKEFEALTVVAFSTLYEQMEQMYEAESQAVSGGDPAQFQEIVSNVPAPPSDPEAMVVKDSLTLLADPRIASTALDHVRYELEANPSVLLLLTETLQSMAPQSIRPALSWMSAKAYEDMGEIAKAEAALAEAEALDPGWPSILVELARYASDRGDAQGGLALLRRAGVPNSQNLLQLLQSHQPKGRPGMSRNQPCWCGSGRKYKMCHRDSEQLPLEDRASWLYHKAGMHLESERWRTELMDLAVTRLGYAALRIDRRELLSNGLIVDAVLFEAGGFEDFLAIRGDLLPEDERMLAAQWLLSERSVYEVERVRAGFAVGLRDVRTGDRVEVREKSASRQMKPGMLICTRVLPAGDVHRMFGGIEPVALHQRDALIDLLDNKPAPVEIVDFLSRRFAPPEVQNTEGEPLVMCEGRCRVPDPAALSTALDATYSRDEDGEPTWFEYITTHGQERIRAVLRLEGDELQLEANSETRYERVLDTITEMAPEVTLIGERRRPVDEIEPEESDAESDSAIDLTDPAVQEALQQFIRQQEQSWLDESIPALDGVTPRQAAADPTRRPDLIRLLDTWPDVDEAAIAMSPRRLREALQLDS